jgi:hypothetical protein
MLIDYRCCFLAADRMLLIASDGFRASAGSHLCAGKARLLEQRLQPRLELVVEIVHEDDPCPGYGAAVGERRLVEFRVAVWAHDGG